EGARQDPGDRDRPVDADAVVDVQDRRRVRADRHERPVAERDLAVLAGEDVQADDRDEVDPDEREPVVEVVVERLRQEDDEQRHSREREHAPEDPVRAEGLHYTLLTTTCPNRPAGRTIRTSISTASASGS